MAALTIFVGNREPGTRRNSRLLWLPGPRNVADGLTKYLAVQDLIVAVLSSGMYTVADVEQFVARAANIKQQYKERRSGKKKRRVYRAVSLLDPFLFVLTPEYPPCLAFLNRAVSCSFYGVHSSSHNQVSGLLLSGISQVEHVIFDPALTSRFLGLAERFGIVSEISSTGFFSCSIDLGFGREGGRCGGR